MKWREAVLKRSGYRCQGPGCGLTQREIEDYEGQLQAAHIWPWRDCAEPLPDGVLGGPSLDEYGRAVSARFDPKNGLAACTFKNRRHPKGIGNGYGCHAVIDRWGSKVPPGVNDQEVIHIKKELGTFGALFGSPCYGEVTYFKLIVVWFLQGFGVFSFEVTPLWVLFAVYILGGLSSPRELAWWLFSMIPATTIGLYLNRWLHRRSWPSRILRAAAREGWAGLTWVAHELAGGVRAAWRRIRRQRQAV